VVILEDRRLAGVEATLAWSHPQFGMLDHNQCVLAAERIGLIHELGQWLLRTAAEQTASWRQHNPATAPLMMVNLAPAQAQDPDLVARVRTILNDTGLKPPELELRVPVTAIRTAGGELAGEGGLQGEDNLGVLTELGLRTGLHEFAGGVGALRCLAEVPVHTVRIAQTISEHVGTEPSRADPVLVPTLRTAGIDVIAFPIESTEQATCWAGIGANWAAGTLFGPPGPPRLIETLLE
jgi:EAL domain-containing protein (putative c-di-GMP-specific phosphodiesterase class I)